jgi:hypothetical protein
MADVPKKRAAWTRPRLRRLDAREAEVNFNSGPDNSIVS